MADVTVRYWAGAQRAAARDEETVDVATVGELRELLRARPALTSIATVATFLVDESPAGDTTVLASGAVIDVLPPFAGG